jgi:solute carrier family 25 (adenine nucleotide translocator) protein 4/5/6/31
VPETESARTSAHSHRRPTMSVASAPTQPPQPLTPPPSSSSPPQGNDTPPPIIKSKLKKPKTAARDALAGACAGALAKTVVAPIERVKLLMQLQFSIDKTSIKNSETTNAAEGPSKSNRTPPKADGRRLGAFEVAKKVYERQGLLAFWRGNTPNVIRQGGTAAMNFLLMDWYKAAIRPILIWSLSLPSDRDPQARKKRRAIISSFLSGGLAGGTVTTVLYPVEFIRTRLAMDVGRGTADVPRLYPGGMRDVCSTIWKVDGWRGFYQGYGIALAGVVLYRALHLGGYDAVKTEILHRRGHNIGISGAQQGSTNDSNNNTATNLTMGERFLAAQIVSLTAGTACYPIDSVRRRLMMQAGLPIERRLYKNSLDCFRRVWATEGMHGFYLGIGPNLIRSFGASLLLVSYDVFKVML